MKRQTLVQWTEIALILIAALLIAYVQAGGWWDPIQGVEYCERALAGGAC